MPMPMPTPPFESYSAARLPTRSEFYRKVKERDAELEYKSKRSALFALAATTLPAVAVLIALGMEIRLPQHSLWIWVAYMTGFLVLYSRTTNRTRNALSRKHGMLCPKCRSPQEGSNLVHAAFTSSCIQCGTELFSGTDSAEVRSAA